MKMSDRTKSGTLYRWTERQYCRYCKQSWVSWLIPGVCPRCRGATIVEEPEDVRIIPPPKALRVRPTNGNRKLFTWGGKTQCIAEWAAEWGVTPTTISYRLHHGWAWEDIYAKYHNIRETRSGFRRGCNYTPKTKKQALNFRKKVA